MSDYLPGVVVRDGGDVLAISRASGLYRSPDGVAAMSVQSGATGVTASCLTQLEDELWVCADNFGLDRMGLGRSPDALTWTRVMTLLDLLGPVACPAGTLQRDQCERGTWCFYVDLYDLPSDEVDMHGRRRRARRRRRGTRSRPVLRCQQRRRAVVAVRGRRRGGGLVAPAPPTAQ